MKKNSTSSFHSSPPSSANVASRYTNTFDGIPFSSSEYTCTNASTVAASNPRPTPQARKSCSLHVCGLHIGGTLRLLGAVAAAVFSISSLFAPIKIGTLAISPWYMASGTSVFISTPSIKGPPHPHFPTILSPLAPVVHGPFALKYVFAASKLAVLCLRTQSTGAVLPHFKYANSPPPTPAL